MIDIYMSYAVFKSWENFKKQNEEFHDFGKVQKSLRSLKPKSYDFLMLNYKYNMSIISIFMYKRMKENWLD